MKSYQKMIGAAKTFAHEAGSIVGSSRKRQWSVSTKSTDNDMVTNVDKETERYLVDMIRKEFPDDSVIGEEGTGHQGSSGISWVVDPIDGTTNFIYGFPSYSVSVGIQDGERSVGGAVFNVMENTLYWAEIGKGAFKDSTRIHVRDQVPIGNSLVGTGFGYSARRRIAQAEFLARIIGDVRDIRRAGAASLDLCYVAEGRLDGYYESGLWPWDYTAASVIVREAGGIILGPTDGNPSRELTIAASNQELAYFMREKILPYVPFPEE